MLPLPPKCYPTVATVSNPVSFCSHTFPDISWLSIKITHFLFIMSKVPIRYLYDTIYTYVLVSIGGTFVRDRNDVLCWIKMWLRAESSLITPLQRLCFGEKALSSHLYSVSNYLGTKIGNTCQRQRSALWYS